MYSVFLYPSSHKPRFPSIYYEWFHQHFMYFNVNCFTVCYILITNLMHWLLFIHKILFSSTCFEPQVIIFRRIQLYTCSVWYCNSLREFMVACRYTAWVRTDCRGKVVGGCCRGKVVGGCLKTPTNNLPPTAVYRREWQYHTLHVYNCILLKMITWGSKHVEEKSILWINNKQCIKLVINI